VGTTPNGRGVVLSEREAAKKRSGKKRTDRQQRTTKRGEKNRRTKDGSGDGLPFIDDALVVVEDAAGRIRSAVRSVFG
jgi:hypothetical protein